MSYNKHQDFQMSPCSHEPGLIYYTISYSMIHNFIYEPYLYLTNYLTHREMSCNTLMMPSYSVMPPNNIRSDQLPYTFATITNCLSFKYLHK